MSQNLRPNPSFLNIFQKIPSEINSTHPFYTILIPNTSYVKIFIMFVGGPQWAKNYFALGVPKVLYLPCTQHFYIFFIGASAKQYCIRNGLPIFFSVNRKKAKRDRPDRQTDMQTSRIYGS